MQCFQERFIKRPTVNTNGIYNGKSIYEPKNPSSTVIVKQSAIRSIQTSLPSGIVSHYFRGATVFWFYVLLVMLKLLGKPHIDTLTSLPSEYCYPLYEHSSTVQEQVTLGHTWSRLSGIFRRFELLSMIQWYHKEGLAKFHVHLAIIQLCKVHNFRITSEYKFHNSWNCSYLETVICV